MVADSITRYAKNSMCIRKKRSQRLTVDSQKLNNIQTRTHKGVEKLRLKETALLTWHVQECIGLYLKQVMHQ